MPGNLLEEPVEILEFFFVRKNGNAELFNPTQDPLKTVSFGIDLLH